MGGKMNIPKAENNWINFKAFAVFGFAVFENAPEFSERSIPKIALLNMDPNKVPIMAPIKVNPTKIKNFL